jgi:hypothetical protein
MAPGPDAKLIEVVWKKRSLVGGQVYPLPGDKIDQITMSPRTKEPCMGQPIQQQLHFEARLYSSSILRARPIFKLRYRSHGDTGLLGPCRSSLPHRGLPISQHYLVLPTSCNSVPCSMRPVAPFTCRPRAPTDLACYLALLINPRSVNGSGESTRRSTQGWVWRCLASRNLSNEGEVM